MFKVSETKLLQNRSNFNSKNITVDFEESIHLAAKEDFSQSHIVGCRFPLCQLW